MAMVTVPVRVSGECPQCGQTNHATINAQIDTNAMAVLVTADAGCGACGSTMRLSADATP